jgi:hypothetical protein
MNYVGWAEAGSGSLLGLLWMFCFLADLASVIYNTTVIKCEDKCLAHNPTLKGHRVVIKSK